MTAVSITDAMLARVGELLKAEQPNLTIESVCRAFNQTIGTPLTAFDQPFEVRAAGVGLWGTLHGISPGLVIFEGREKIGIFRRTKDTPAEILFAVAWIPKGETQPPFSETESKPVIRYAISEPLNLRATFMGENNFTPINPEVWAKAKEWLDIMLPAPPPDPEVKSPTTPTD